MSVPTINLQSPALPTELSADADDTGKHECGWGYDKLIPLAFQSWDIHSQKKLFIFKLLMYEMNGPVILMRARGMTHYLLLCVNAKYRFRQVLWQTGAPTIFTRGVNAAGAISWRWSAIEWLPFSPLEISSYRRLPSHLQLILGQLSSDKFKENFLGCHSM